MSWSEIISLQFQMIICFIIYTVISRKKTHLAVNRWYLILTPILLLLASQLSPLYDSAIQSIVRIELSEVVVNMTNSSSSTISIITILYSIGVIISLAIFILQLIRVLRQPVIKQLTKNDTITVYLIDNKADSFSFFNRIYISESQLHQVEYILKHEKAHCIQRHSWDILLIQIFQIAFWFNPIFILWKRKMKENHEYLADKASIKSNAEIESYSYALLSAQLGVNIPQLGNGFNEPSLLHKRIIQLKSQNKITMKHLLLVPALVGTALLTVSLTVPSKSEIQSPKTIVTELDQQPEFPGGMNAMIAYFQKNMKYPEALKESKAEGKVFIAFTVLEDGAISKVSVFKSSEIKSFDDEAVRLIKEMPKWKPGIKEGKKVATELTLPIVFQY